MFFVWPLQQIELGLINHGNDRKAIDLQSLRKSVICTVSIVLEGKCNVTVGQ